jgi:GGDEF domain-containing protein
MKFPIPPALLEFLTPNRLFAKLTITRKMLIGYLMLVILTAMVIVYALASLQRINALNREIVMVDIPIQVAADTMLDAITAQDTYEKRYLILHGEDMLSLFRKRGKEFESVLTSLQQKAGKAGSRSESIGRLHETYGTLFSREVRLVRAGDYDGAADLSKGRLKNVFEKLLVMIRGLSAQAQQSQEDRMKSISRTATAAFITTAILCLLGIILGALSSMVVTHHIFSSIDKLAVATMYVAEGEFHYDPQIKTEDEIGALAGAFIVMGKRLGKLEEMYLDASPLTRLPGGIAIENVLKRRIESKKTFAFCVIDLDNFKVFNDRYGYANGNEVIRETARIIDTAARAKGTAEDFVGHVGGDDFVVITIPDKMRDVCGEVIRVFDSCVPSFYNEQDRRNGFIIGKNRQGQEMQYPLMTISIAIVTNEQRNLINPLEASELAAELKDYAKTIPSSLYVVDKRRSV